jgi:hypothetical protein
MTEIHGDELKGETEVSVSFKAKEEELISKLTLQIEALNQTVNEMERRNSELTLKIKPSSEVERQILYLSILSP